jgi:hypothetical protein
MKPLLFRREKKLPGKDEPENLYNHAYCGWQSCLWPEQN